MSTVKPTAPRSWPDAFLFAGAVLLLYLGWSERHDTWRTAEAGLGYTLGIIGGGMMLGLLLYPLRKKARWMRHFGPVAAWFRTHMWLGVLGPVAVLYHANFKLGSLNSNVALAAMSAVTLSGLVGRYLYTKVHRGLYASRLSLGELRGKLAASRADLAETLARVPEIDAALHAVEAAALTPSTGILNAWFRSWRLKYLAGRARHTTRRALRAHGFGAETYRTGIHFVRAHARAARRIAEFSLYDRLLSLWHLLHLPLFLLLLLAGIVHVVAVHMY